MIINNYTYIMTTSDVNSERVLLDDIEELFDRLEKSLNKYTEGFIDRELSRMIEGYNEDKPN